MHTRGTSLQKLRMDPRTPSFSSSLLDEIYSSIDDGSARENRRTERARQETKKKNFTPEKNDALFFSSGSSLFSEPSSTKTRASSSSRIITPKPIRKNAEELDREEAPSSAKSRALKLYARLKKMKQPISPGMKLSSLIDSILQKKKSTPQTTPFRSSSFVPKRVENEAEVLKNRELTRVDREKVRHQVHPMERNGALVKPGSKTASFIGSNSVPKRVGIETNLVKNRALTRVDHEKVRYQVHAMKQNGAFWKPEQRTRVGNPNDDLEDPDCGASECSEDLFEIDHLKLCRGRDFGDLPVFETTRVGSSNRSSRVV